jgi:hypothetical protein
MQQQDTTQRVPAREHGNPIPLRTLIWHSALEFLLTFVLLFGASPSYGWVGDRASAVARAIPHHIRLQLLIIGTAVGLLITGLILEPARSRIGRPGHPPMGADQLFGAAPDSPGQDRACMPIGGYLRVSSPRSSP